MATLPEYAGTGRSAAFFFAGHGVVLSDLNYLMPRDVPNVGEAEETVLREGSIRFNGLMDDLREKRVRVALMILDACRNNPFRDSRGRSVGNSRGLARVEAAKGSFVMYSAGNGEEALDGLSINDPHPNSLYTRTLLPILQTPNLGLPEIARRARREVAALARTVGRDQTPAYYDEPLGDFILKPEQPPPSPAPQLIVPPVAALQSPAPPLVAPEHECDRLTATGVLFEDLDEVRAVPACRAAAKAYPGEPRFEASLGRALIKAKSYEEARSWLEKAAEKGNAAAMSNLGSLYANGHGVPQDYAKARAWYEKAAAKGMAGAMRNLALLLDRGSGVARNSSVIARHLLAAARQGLDDAKQDLQSAMSSWSQDTRKAVQQVLKEEGIYQGQIDGTWNDASREAAKRYWESGGKK